ncbi:MAG: hypothetical protein NT011_09325 [Kiritimatiellaeota bacterium]|nr:hypothetical protein [Kiritimatiellota bacterium]
MNKHRTRPVRQAAGLDQRPMKAQCVKRMLIGLGLAMALAVPWASATNYYVVTSSQQPAPTPPWTNWGWAHTNLIEVVAAARDNDTLYVTNNATYNLTNQIIVSYAITVRSWGPGGILDPTNTILSGNGNYPNATNRHFTLNNYGATLAGFTLKNGCESNGGAIWLKSGMVTNCTIVSNVAYNLSTYYGGGGVYMNTSSGGVWNCVFSGNTSSNSGGGICIKGGGPFRIADCIIYGNSGLALGGGIIANPAAAGTIFNNCWVISNYAKTYGGGIYLLSSAQCHNSLIMGNTCGINEGGGVRMGDSSLLRNCLVVGNIATNSSDGGVYLNWNASIKNCTIASNVAYGSGGGLGFLGAYGNNGHPSVENTIIWGNSSAGTGVSNYYIYATNTAESCVAFTNCSTSPNIVSIYASDINTISNNPRYVNDATGDFRLQSDSPCIDAGVNRGWMEGALDFYGNRRIDNFRKTVDIGAYEFLAKGTVFGFQ